MELGEGRLRGRTHGGQILGETAQRHAGHAGKHQLPGTVEHVRIVGTDQFHEFGQMLLFVCLQLFERAQWLLLQSLVVGRQLLLRKLLLQRLRRLRLLR